MANILAVVLSYVCVVLLALVAGWLLKKGRVNGEQARKLVHIGVAHWWFILMFGINDPFWALLGPLSFIVINILALRLPLFAALQSRDKDASLGTVWFPVSLLVLVVLVYFAGLPGWCGGIGVLVLGWGDGCAALAGMGARRGRFDIFGRHKSLRGVLVMAAVSSLVSALMIVLFFPSVQVSGVIAVSLALGIAACLVEVLTPGGLDNISIPLVVTFLGWVFLSGYGKIGTLQGVDAAWWFLCAFGVNALFAAAAFAMRTVQASGAFAGVCAGTILLWLGGWPAWLVLVSFFLSSALLGKLSRKDLPDSGIEAKGSRRDATQVFANCGPGIAAFVVYSLTGTGIWLLAFAVAFAASTADTWASESAGWRTKPPRDILTLKPVPAGTSGGVSLPGFGASLLGAGCIGAVFMCGFWPLLVQGAEGLPEVAMILVLIALGGFLGSLADSVLGATVQALYHDVDTQRRTERALSRVHLKPNLLVKGWPWMTNDLVNCLSVLLAACVAAGIGGLISG